MSEMKSGKINAVIPMIMSELGAIGKKQKNESQGYNFRGIDDIYNALQPVLINNGCHFEPTVEDFMHKEVIKKKGQYESVLIYAVVKVRYKLVADDDSFIECVVMGEAMDSGDKAMNKAMSAAMKYAAFQLFCIPTQEMIDSERDTPVNNKDGETLVPSNRNITMTAHNETKCEECGQQITPVALPNGDKYTPEQIAMKTRARYGKCLCWNCSTKAKNG